MPASGLSAPAGISEIAAPVSQGQLAGAAARMSTPLDFDAAGGTAYRRRMSEGADYLDPDRPDLSCADVMKCRRPFGDRAGRRSIVAVASLPCRVDAVSTPVSSSQPMMARAERG